MFRGGGLHVSNRTFAEFVYATRLLQDLAQLRKNRAKIFTTVFP